MATIVFAVLLAAQQERAEAPATPEAQQAKKQQEEVVFSGPQVGEKLPSLPVKLVGATEPVDLVKKYGDGPLAVVFFHKLTRPGFALSRKLAEYGQRRSKDKLQLAVVFLTDDPPSMEKQLANISRLIKQSHKDVLVGVSTDGADGPGPYGLNRNILLTVLVTKGRKVVGNFALGQPSLNVDGPRIFDSIFKMLGGGKKDYEDLLSDQRMRTDPQLARMFRPLTTQKFADEEIDKRIAELEKYVGNNRARKAQLGTLAANLSRGERMMNAVPNAKVREKLKAWAKFAGRPNMRGNNNQRKPADEQDPNIRPLLRPFIQKSNTDEETIAAAKKVEDYAAKNAKARGQIGDICRQIINADKLSNYGTKKCQEYMQTWAKKWKPAKERDEGGNRE